MLRRRLRTALAGLAFLAVASSSGVTLAQPSAADAALAEKLFEDGRALMAQKNYAEACPKLAESQRLDPGVGTLLNLGECYEKSGKIASAWATYHDADAIAGREGQKKRAAFAAARVKALAKDLSYLVLEAGGPQEGLRIQCDGETLGDKVLGSTLPLDAGSHKLEVKAPGKVPWTTTFELAVRQTVRIAIPELENVPAAPPPPPPPPTSIVLAAPPPPPGRDGSAQRITGFALGGVGVLALGAGSFFGLRAASLHDDAETNHCDPTSCDPRGAELTSDARSAATVSTVLFAVGGAAIAAGVIVYLASPRLAQQAPTAILSPARFVF